MPWRLKGQKAQYYIPSKTRPPTGLSPVNEAREKALARWNRLRQAIMRQTAIKKARRVSPLPPGWKRKGRFLVGNANNNTQKRTSPKTPVSNKNVKSGVYGRFTVTGPSPKRNNTMNKYRNLQTKIIELEERIHEMKREFFKKITPLEDRLDEYYEQSKNLKKRL